MRATSIAKGLLQFRALAGKDKKTTSEAQGLRSLFQDLAIELRVQRATLSNQTQNKILKVFRQKNYG